MKKKSNRKLRRTRDSNSEHSDLNPSFRKVKNNQENIGDSNHQHSDSNPQTQNALNTEDNG